MNLDDGFTGSSDNRTALPPSVVLATHYLLTGAPTALDDYLTGHANDFLSISHPLFVGRLKSKANLYRHGTLVDSRDRPGPSGVFRYPVELYRTVRWTIAARRAFDAFVAADSLLAFAGLFLRRMGRVSSVVLYSVDYVPKRFSNRLVNAIYHRVDRIASRKVDIVWSVSEQIIAARRTRDGRETAVPQIVVPVGAHFGRIIKLPLDRANRFQIGFTGHLLEKQGVQLAIRALPEILHEVPEASLLIIGEGPYAATLKTLADELGVSPAVEFTGRIADHAELERRLASCAIAIAPYVPDPSSFTWYADPAKIKTYLACGVPVLVTAVPPSASLIASRGAGQLVDYSIESLSSAVVRYLTHPDELQRARDAAVRLGSEFAWENIFSTAWEKTASQIDLRREATVVSA